MRSKIKMDKINKKAKNIYRTTRENMNLTRQKVADMISELDPSKYEIFDEHRLNKIERESIQQIHPEEIVTLAKIYNKPELRNHYCCNHCAIGKIDAPEVDNTGCIYEILVGMAVTLKKLNHSKIRLMEILEDEKISKDETADFKRICEDLERISATVEAIQLWCEKKKVVC